jgi:hypothetical protein
MCGEFSWFRERGDGRCGLINLMVMFTASTQEGNRLVGNQNKFYSFMNTGKMFFKGIKNKLHPINI